MRKNLVLPILLIVGVLLISGCTQGEQPSKTGSDSMKKTTDNVDKGATAPPKDAEITPSVTVKDQTVKSGTVTIENVVSAQTGWLVIHNDKEGSFADVLGQTLVQKGENSNVVVKIDESKWTETLYAMLHLDTGVAGVYEFGDVEAADGPVVVDGKVVTPSFKAMAPSAPTAKSDTVSTMKTFALTGENFKFVMDGKDNPELRVKEGDTVKIEFTSKAGTHDWSLDEFNAKTDMVGTDKTASVEFVADKKGTFEYYCSVGSHRALGMKGKLTVE